MEHYSFANYDSIWTWYPELEPTPKSGVLIHGTAITSVRLLSEHRLKGILEERDHRVLVGRVETGPYAGKFVDLYEELWPIYDPSTSEYRNRGDLAELRQ